MAISGFARMPASGQQNPAVRDGSVFRGKAILKSFSSGNGRRRGERLAGEADDRVLFKQRAGSREKFGKPGGDGFDGLLRRGGVKTAFTAAR
jgi:hypothetical protein